MNENERSPSCCADGRAACKRRVRCRFAELAGRAVRTLLDESYALPPAHKLNRALRTAGMECELGTAENGQFIGQVLRDGELVAYASLVAKQK